MAIREGLWDCQWCNQTGILGRHKECPQCGRSRPEGTKFYLPGNAPAVTDAKLLQIAQSGPDWVCEHCGSSNANERNQCSHCNAVRGSSPSQTVKDYSTAAVPQTGDNAPIENPKSQTPFFIPQSPNPRPNRPLGHSGRRYRRGLLSLPLRPAANDPGAEQ